ncbi:MAG: NAD(P)H-dependent oxidoreductase subunit E [Sedimentisphaerales bacterium]|nr:NAD(P)H-dependent oxidoreductase subunit E [Sedimentisphaerales bacterium]
MSENWQTMVKDVCARCGNDRTRMMDIVRLVQQECGCVSGEAMDLIARQVDTHRVEVESVVSFYAFLSNRPKGKIVIRLCNDVIDEMFGARRVAQAFEQQLGIEFGQTTPDGLISLEHTPCIGMCDQAPAALVNDVVVTYLSRDKVGDIVSTLKSDPDPRKLVHKLGDGNNASELVQSMVHNNIRRKGPVIFDPLPNGEALKRCLALSPAEVIRDVKTARLRGRGGAGFPTGMKWEFARAAAGAKKFVICNADEGEPGTFKDRVLLTERADMLFEGMTIAGYAIGSDTGILYLRGEYAYLRAFLEDVLHQRRNAGLLGKAVCGKQGFDFDIRIQMGAGAYICGEETALISSCEGLRGDPKNRPPFPAQKGYLERPTIVNNVETFCCVTRILDRGPAWFAEKGSKGSPGTKLLSVCGDCKQPGVYEVLFGITLAELLKMVGAEDAKAVQVGGPSGQLVGPSDYQRTICYDDLATGGSIMVFGPNRDILPLVDKFMEFFIEETCGYCTPCRVGNVLLRQKLQEIMAGKGEAADLDYLEDLGQSIVTASRCGLGQTSANPILTSLKNFRGEYTSRLIEPEKGMKPTFDIQAAVREAAAIAGRGPAHS